MHQYTILIVTLGMTAVLLTQSSALATVETTNLCPPDASPKMRQLCLLASLEQYLAENPHDLMGLFLGVYPINWEPIKIIALRKMFLLADVLDTQLYDRGTKRQDVDHVFLRFGRRLGL